MPQDINRNCYRSSYVLLTVYVHCEQRADDPAEPFAMHTQTRCCLLLASSLNELGARASSQT
jgi:hypothetical protein